MATGTATVDFGATAGQRATATVTGQTAIAPSSHASAFLMSDTSADHSDYEHQMAAMVLEFTCGNIVAGVGFDIIAVSTIKLQGAWTVHWVWV